MSEPWTPRQRRLLEGANIAHLATLLPDGAPHVAPVWIDVKEGIIRVNTARGRVKLRNVLRDPRVALSLTSQDDPYTKVLVRGRVEEVTREGAAEHIHALARKYLGRDYPYGTEDRVLLTVRPTWVSD